jgi:hypothetical protein
MHLIPLAAVKPVQDVGGTRKPAVLECLYRPCQRSVPVGNSVEKKQAGKEREEYAAPGNPDAQLDDIASLEHSGDRVVLLSAQDDVEIPLHRPLRRNRGDRKDFPPFGTSRIVAQDGERFRPVQKRFQGPQGNTLPFYLAGGSGVGEDSAVLVEQVHFDPGMDGHQHVENLPDRIFLHAAVLYQGCVRCDVPGKGPVELLRHFLEMDPVCEKGQ